jgi:catechol 2,3-dioxygenase-like lactoylglutathione lyase family enzyme
MIIPAVRLNHAVLFVTDVEHSVRFWTEAFGMEVAARERRGNAVFLPLPRSGNHHDLGLFGLGNWAPTNPRRRSSRST